MRARSTLATGAAVAGVVAAFPSVADAHGIVGRTDLPIPPWLFAWCAGVVLVVSFVALATLWREPRFQRSGTRAFVRVPAVLDPLCGLLGVAAFALVVAAGLFGTQLATTNLAPTAVYVVFWVAIPFASVVLGDVFRPFNPWRAVARGASWVAGRMAPGAGGDAMTYPARLGRWPAATTLVAFAWVELVDGGGQSPRLLAVLALVYAAVQLVGMSLYGIDVWTARADGFAVAFGLIASMSPLTVRDGRLLARTPLAGALGIELVPGTLAVLIAMLGTTTFDGASNGALWVEAEPWLQARAASLGLAPTPAAEAAGTVGMAICLLVVGVVFRAGVAGIRTVAPTASLLDLARRFAPTLLPIAFAYLVAHYVSLLVLQGQAMAYLLSDPFGTGANLFGTANASIDYNALSPTAVWYLQVVALVVGHIGGLVLAHERALTTWPDSRIAVQSQYWMLAVMVGYTCLGLWLLSAVST